MTDQRTATSPALRFRFGLRSMFVLVTVVSVLVCCCVLYRPVSVEVRGKLSADDLSAVLAAVAKAKSAQGGLPSNRGVTRVDVYPVPNGQPGEIRVLVDVGECLATVTKQEGRWTVENFDCFPYQ